MKEWSLFYSSLKHLEILEIIVFFFLIYPSTSNEYRQKIHAIIKMLADYQKLFTYLRMQTSDI